MTQPSRPLLVSFDVVDGCTTSLYIDVILSSLLFDLYYFILIKWLGKFWEAAQNRRELLEKFAASKGCDPLLSHFWYNLNPAELRSVKVSISSPLSCLSSAFSLLEFVFSHPL